MRAWWETWVFLHMRAIRGSFLKSAVRRKGPCHDLAGSLLQTPVLHSIRLTPTLFTTRARTIPFRTWSESYQTTEVESVSASGAVIGISKFSLFVESGRRACQGRREAASETVSNNQPPAAEKARSRSYRCRRRYMTNERASRVAEKGLDARMTSRWPLFQVDRKGEGMRSAISAQRRAVAYSSFRDSALSKLCGHMEGLKLFPPIFRVVTVLPY